MKQQLRSLSLVFLALTTLAIGAIAQTETLNDNLKVTTNSLPFEVGVMLGMSSYEGDVRCLEDEKTNVFTKSKFAFGININKNLSKNFSAGLTYSNTTLSGSDQDGSVSSGRTKRNFNFSNNLNEIALRLNYFVLGHKQPKLSPYIFGGAGFSIGSADVNYNVNQQSAQSKALISKDISESSSSSMVLPLGIGFRFALSELINVKAEVGMRFGANDYLDGVSNSGSTKYGDYYGMGGVVVSYSFGSNVAKSTN
jgi:hypothetical protein